MKQVFFDANVWIEYCWKKQFGNPHKTDKKNTIPIHKLAVRKTALVVTEPLMYEITKHFKDYYLLQKVIADGFSTFQFSRVRRDYKLSKTDRDEIDKIYSLVTSSPSARQNMLLNWLDEKTLGRVYRLINLYHFEMLDCMHIVAAEEAGCTVFVTKDEELLKQASDAKRVFRKLKGIDFIKPSEFRSSYSTLFRK